MESDKNFQEEYDEILEKLSKVYHQIISDIARTDGGLDRLRIMHENHEKLTKYNMTHAHDSNIILIKLFSFINKRILSKFRDDNELFGRSDYS